MNLEELRSVQDAERRQSGLQPLRESFYEEAGEYITDLKRERERAADRAEDPFSSTEVRQITDEIETAEEVLEAIYERRMGKLLKRASLAAAEMSVDEEGLTAEERELFEDLVERITSNKERVLKTLAGDSDDHDDGGGREQAGTRSEDPTRDRAADRPSPSSDPGSTATDPAGRPEGETSGGSGRDSRGERDPTGEPASADHQEVPPEPAPDALAGASTPGSDGGDRDPDGSTAGDAPDPTRSTDGGGTIADDPGPPADRVTVQITDDVGAIYGVDDREYDLSSEDVVTLPSENAEPLVQQGAAEKLDGRD